MTLKILELQKKLGIIEMKVKLAKNKQAGELILEFSEKPFVETPVTSELLINIPDLDQPKITIAVYSFPDRTGQRKPNSKFSQLSTALAFWSSWVRKV